MTLKENSESHSGFQIVRWLGALAVALGAAAYYIDGVNQSIVCEDSVVSMKGKIVERGPPGLTELLPFALIIAILLAPDLGELGIPGLLSVKRKVRQQEDRQDALETKLMRIEQNVEQRVEQTQNFHFGDIMEAGRQFQEKLTAIVEAGASTDATVDETDQIDLQDPPGEPLGLEVEPSGGHPREDEAELAETPEATTADRHDEVQGEAASDADQRASLTLQLLYLVKTSSNTRRSPACDVSTRASAWPL